MSQDKIIRDNWDKAIIIFYGILATGVLIAAVIDIIQICKPAETESSKKIETEKT